MSRILDAELLIIAISKVLNYKGLQSEAKLQLIRDYIEVYKENRELDISDME